jgi:hypothetical protein
MNKPQTTGETTMTTLSGLKEVTKEEFYKSVGPLNVHPHIIGNYPYTSIYQFPDRREHGRTVDYIPEGKALAETRYYLKANGTDEY